MRTRHDASADDDGDPCHLSRGDVAFARVDAGSHVEPERADTIDNRLRAPDGAPGAIERREEAVARGIDLLATVAGKLASHKRVVPLQEVGPRTVTERGCTRRRVGDVSEQHGRQDTVRGKPRNIRRKRLHLSEHLLLSCSKWRHCSTDRVHDPRVRETVCEIANPFSRRADANHRHRNVHR